MMYSSSTKKTAFIIICAFLLLISVVLLSIGKKTEQSDISAKQTAAANSSYTLGEFDGKLAVFKAGTAKPIEVYDVFIENLPEPDRQLITGKRLTTSSKTQLILWIEDYIS